VFAYRQQMLGAPFKPSVGLSGIAALVVPVSLPSARPKGVKEGVVGPYGRSGCGKSAIWGGRGPLSG
jgi:hypothetical protein